MYAVVRVVAIIWRTNTYKRHKVSHHWTWGSKREA